MLNTIDKIAKAMMLEVALMWGQVLSLSKENKSLSQSWKPKSAHILLGGSLTIQDAAHLLEHMEVGGEVVLETQQGGDCVTGACMKVWCCGIFGKPGYNA